MIRAVLSQSPCPTAVYDTRLRLLGINDAMAGVLGLVEDRIRGLRISEIGGERAGERLEEDMYDVLVSGRGRDVETTLRTGGEGRPQAWLTRMAPLTDADGQVRGVCVAAHDFTEQTRPEVTFPAELVVSELVTNAIRYGEPPIRLRLIHDADTLICEVSDSSHTAPHLRRAKIFDEGGRGLLLVAQLTQRWGSRHTPEGKTIWAELTLLGKE
ncbi:PAS domain-containing protein [Streptomyces sp. 142MFCol3.1]|uniref:PAS domain-containing protein n=1 Tax=Streptomyces sp. 142MFCol3.1 TaxID=1172179 RepID=UPI003B63E7AC